METRTAPPPKPDEAALKAMMEKVQRLAPIFRTEFLEHA
jgi:hypothetical protein